MAKYTRAPHVEDHILTLMHEDMKDPSRSAQIPSVSGLIKCLTKYYYDNNSNAAKTAVPSRRLLMLFATGLGLESQLLRGRQFNQVLQVDGIWGHYDHLQDGDLLFELKSTRISSKRPPEDLPYDKQIKSYFKMTGARKLYLTVLHLMGGYQPPFPDLVVWDVEFDDKEVEDHWNWMKERRDVYAAAVEAGVAPKQFTYNDEYECEECPYKAICDLREEGLLP